MGKFNSFLYFLKEFGYVTTIKLTLHYFFLILGSLIKSSFINTGEVKMFLIPKDSGISAELKIFKVHEPLGTSILKKQIKPGMNIIDIGSNIGYYALIEAQKCGSTGRVIAIEPNPLAFKYLLKNVKINNLNIICKNIAIWDKKGFIDFVIVPESNLCYVKGVKNGLVNEKDNSENNVIKVTAITFDNILKDIGNRNKIYNIDLIRMDVEGAEWQILNGAWNTIEKFNPMIFIELHISILGEVKSRLLLEKLKNLGYEIKYVILRHKDIPILYNFNDIEYIDITSLISRLPSMTRSSLQIALLIFFESS